MKIQKEIGDINGIALSHNNFGMIYFKMKNYDEALMHHQEAMHIREKIGDKKGIADSYYFIAEAYRVKQDYTRALENHLNALKIEIEIGYNLGIADSYVDIGNVYLLQKNYREAIVYLNKGLLKAKEMGLLDDLKKGYGGLAEAHAGLRDFKNAYEFHKLFLAVKDSIMNNENTKEITEMRVAYDQDKKDKVREEQEKAAAQQRKATHDKEVIIRDSFIGGFAIVLLFAGIFFRQRNNISKEKKRSDNLLLNILPEETAEELKHTGTAKTKTYKMVSVMFTDFKNFTQASEKLTPEELVKEIHECYSEFDRIIERHFIEKIKTIGDSYMCAAGLPIANTTNAVDAVQAAIEIRNFMMARKYTSHSGREGTAFDIRIGVHTGPVVAGIVGIKKFAYDIWGDTVNIASRMESSGETGKVNISGATYELVKDKFACTHRGKISAKNKGEVDMYFVEPL
jgi:class 3 adenylate cyclase